MRLYKSKLKFLSYIIQVEVFRSESSFANLQICNFANLRSLPGDLILKFQLGDRCARFAVLGDEDSIWRPNQCASQARRGPARGPSIRSAIYHLCDSKRSRETTDFANSRPFAWISRLESNVSRGLAMSR